MLARRRFLQAIQETFGEERVRRVQSGGLYDTDEDEDEDVDVEMDEDEADIVEDDETSAEANKSASARDVLLDSDQDVGSEIYDYDSDLYRE